MSQSGSTTIVLVEASDSGGAAPDSHRLPKLHGPLISLQLWGEAYHRTGAWRKFPAMELTFLLGGVRAGKSAKALELARERAERGGLFVATVRAAHRVADP